MEKHPCDAQTRTTEAARTNSDGAQAAPTASTSRSHGEAVSGYEMACHHPLPAWQTRNGEITLAREKADSYQLRLPCGGCLGCRMANAKAWALRCQLELQQHRAAVVTTLTYDDQHKPITLEKRALQLFLKKLRRHATQPVRFFACGEYGEQNARPHYHAILYGLDVQQRDRIERAWTDTYGIPLGTVRKTEAVTPPAIAYVAGYCQKKIGWKLNADEKVDPETGEVYTWQPPFIQMSRRPGIGGHARKWLQSWRLYAIHNGQRMAVPRFLHNAWKAQATNQQLEELLYEKSQLPLRDTSTKRLEAAEQIAIAKQTITANQRNL